MNNCPFCSDVLLRHISSGKSYWLCRRCRTEILDREFSQITVADQNQDTNKEIGAALTSNLHSNTDLMNLSVHTFSRL